MHMHLRRNLGAAGACLAAALMATTSAASPAAPLQEVVVTASREGTLRIETPASVSILGAGTIDTLRPTHPAELLGRVPGVAIQQTNGEGHVTGIRQPIDTHAVYLYLEDGVPVRPSGFFNHNALFELNLIQAGSVEVIRGPGTTLHGSDAIGGVINALTRAPEAGEAHVTLDTGAGGWVRAYGAFGHAGDRFGARLDLNLTRSDGWREAFGYERQSLTMRSDIDAGRDTRLRATASLTRIDQQTGANSRLSLEDYRHNPTANYTPIAYRRVDSARAALEVEHRRDDLLLSVTPFLRWSEMDLLPSWMLSYDPVRHTTGYVSIGTLLRARRDFAPARTRVAAGVDLDYSPGFRTEDRLAVGREGRFFTHYAPQQRLYDYDVTFWQSSPYLQIETSPTDRARLHAGLRFDLLGFRYANRLEDGPFITSTPFGPRTFARPSDTDLRYSRLSPSLGATYALTPALHAFASYKHSFRVPQEGQLFRQGGNAASLDLQPVRAVGYEAGLRGSAAGALEWELVAYRLEKEDDILTADFGTGPTLTNNGETRHSGVEAAAHWKLAPEWRLEVAASHAHHRFFRWSSADGTRFDGRTISSAPRTVAATTLAYTPRPASGMQLELEWAHLGGYWLDDANTHRYGGHDLLHLRAHRMLGAHWEVFARVHNALDRRWATSGAVAAGAVELVPGLRRGFYAGVSRWF